MSYVFSTNVGDGSIFSHQKVKHRKRRSLLSRIGSSGKIAYRPAGFSHERHKNLIEVVQQRPVKLSRIRKTRNAGFFEQTGPAKKTGFFKKSNPLKKKAPQSKAVPANKARPGPAAWSFKLPKLPRLFKEPWQFKLPKLPRLDLLFSKIKIKAKPVKVKPVKVKPVKVKPVKVKPAPEKPRREKRPLPVEPVVQEEVFTAEFEEFLTEWLIREDEFTETPAAKSTAPASAAVKAGNVKKPPKEDFAKEGFTFPLAPVAALTALAAFSILCLHWEGNPLSAGEFLPQPGEDSQSSHNMALYAGIVPVSAAVEELIPLDLTGTFAWESYAVKKGDSVSKIAQDHAISYDAIISSNGLTNAKFLREGDVLRLPNMDGIAYKVKEGDSLSKIASSQGIPLEAILDANALESDTLQDGMLLFLPGARMKVEELKQALGELFIYPIRGRLTSPFGWRNDPFTGVRLFHRALDLAASLGTPVKAAQDGQVSVVGNNSVYGKYIIVSHAGSYETMYAHLSAVSVEKGARVQQGAKIGEVGSTGYSTGPHLHFAVYKNGRAVNPLDYLSR